LFPVYFKLGYHIIDQAVGKLCADARRICQTCSSAVHFARGLTIGVGILVASMGARWADEPLCHMHPVGTYFLWHILNAVMLAWMIEVYHRHMLAGKRAKR